MNKTNKQINFTVERSKWYRGKGSSSRLLTKTGQMCCLGFLAKELGYQDQEILKIGTPAGLYDDGKKFPRSFFPKKPDIAKLSDSCWFLVEVNDNPSLTDDKREYLLAKEFEKNNIKVEFID